MSLDNAAMTVYGDSISGNCLKVKFVADRLGIPYDWVEVSVLNDPARREKRRLYMVEYHKRNPGRRSRGLDSQQIAA